MSDSQKNNDGGRMTEGGEPTVNSVHSPLWLFVISGLLLYLGMGFLADQAGGFNKDVFEPYPSVEYVKRAAPPKGVDPILLGQKIYEARGCGGCHGATGAGVPGLNPPLAGSEWVLAEGPNRIARIILNGLNGPITVKGVTYNNQMPAMGAGLSAKELSYLLSYIRNSWGNNASIIKEKDLKDIVEKETGKPQWAPAALLDMPAKTEAAPTK
jgi:mono/diheme cytochrome c family protein